MHTTLISASTLSDCYTDPHCVIVDCRFDLVKPEAGHDAYVASHIPGACYAHLERDLSAAVGPGTGRHPLPSQAALNRTFSEMGIDPERQVVAYDDSGGMFAARMWWLLRYMGHQGAAVLDGGWSAWRDSGLEVHSGEEHRAPSDFQGRARPDLIVDVQAVPGVSVLIDSRAPERYRGEAEPLDPVAGHIPGAKNRPCRENLNEAGFFLPQADLRRSFEDLLGTHPVQEAAVYCGSGVSACQNLLALAHTGLGDGRLYPGSWSEWCRDPRRPVALGGK